jgi:hypothetical protein
MVNTVTTKTLSIGGRQAQLCAHVPHHACSRTSHTWHRCRRTLSGSTLCVLGSSCAYTRAKMKGNKQTTNGGTARTCLEVIFTVIELCMCLLHGAQAYEHGHFFKAQADVFWLQADCFAVLRCGLLEAVHRCVGGAKLDKNGSGVRREGAGCFEHW